MFIKRQRSSEVRVEFPDIAPARDIAPLASISLPNNMYMKTYLWKKKSLDNKPIRESVVMLWLCIKVSARASAPLVPICSSINLTFCGNSNNRWMQGTNGPT